MIWRIWHKEPGWRWWMRFKQPIAQWREQGCFNDACGELASDAAGCRCNGGHRHRKQLVRQFDLTLVATAPTSCTGYVKHLYVNPYGELYEELYHCGR